MFLLLHSLYSIVHYFSHLFPCTLKYLGPTPILTEWKIFNLSLLCVCTWEATCDGEKQNQIEQQGLFCDVSLFNLQSLTPSRSFKLFAISAAFLHSHSHNWDWYHTPLFTSYLQYFLLHLYSKFINTLSDLVDIFTWISTRHLRLNKPRLNSWLLHNLSPPLPSFLSQEVAIPSLQLLIPKSLASSLIICLIS